MDASSYYAFILQVSQNAWFNKYKIGNKDLICWVHDCDIGNNREL